MLKAPGEGTPKKLEDPMVTGGALSSVLTGAPGETEMSRQLFLMRLHDQATIGIPQPTPGIPGATTIHDASGQTFTTLPLPERSQPAEEGAPMGTEPLRVKRRPAAPVQMQGSGDESLWEKSTWEQEADKGIRGSSYLPASAEKAGYYYEGSQGGGQVVNKQGQDVGTYDYFMSHLKQFEGASKEDAVPKKIEESNKLLTSIDGNITKAFTAAGGT